MSDEILKELIAEVVELRRRVAALETQDWVIQDGRFSRSLAVGDTSLNPPAGDIWTTSDGRFGGGLSVGSTGTDPPTGDVWVTSDGRFGGGLSVGSTGIDPPTGDVWVTSDGRFGADGRFGGGLYVGSTAVDPPTGNVWATSDGRFAGGLYSGATNIDPGTGNVVYTGVLKSVKGGTAYTGYAFVPIFQVVGSGWNPKTLSTTSKTKIDVSATFSGVPDGIKAILFYVAVRDKGSSTTDCWIILGATATAGEGTILGAFPVNSRYGRYSVTVPCDSAGDIYYQTTASGTNTMQVWLVCHGYYI